MICQNIRYQLQQNEINIFIKINLDRHKADVENSFSINFRIYLLNIYIMGRRMRPKVDF